jgi:hypothetical protein
MPSEERPRGLYAVVLMVLTALLVPPRRAHAFRSHAWLLARSRGGSRVFGARAERVPLSGTAAAADWLLSSVQSIKGVGPGGQS